MYILQGFVVRLTITFHLPGSKGCHLFNVPCAWDRCNFGAVSLCGPFPGNNPQTANPKLGQKIVFIWTDSWLDYGEDSTYSMAFNHPWNLLACGYSHLRGTQIAATRQETTRLEIRVNIYVVFIFQVLMTGKFPFRLGHKPFRFLYENFLFHDFSLQHFCQGLQVWANWHLVSSGNVENEGAIIGGRPREGWPKWRWDMCEFSLPSPYKCVGTFSCWPSSSYSTICEH